MISREMPARYTLILFFERGFLGLGALVFLVINVFLLSYPPAKEVRSNIC